MIVVDADLDGLSLDFIEKVCSRKINKIENTQESFQNLVNFTVLKALKFQMKKEKILKENFFHFRKQG